MFLYGYYLLASHKAINTLYFKIQNVLMSYFTYKSFLSNIIRVKRKAVPVLFLFFYTSIIFFFSKLWKSLGNEFILQYGWRWVENYIEYHYTIITFKIRICLIIIFF